MFAIRCCLLGVVLFFFFPAYSQTSNPDSSSQQPTFRANVRRVLVDVVVIDNKDEPVTGLPKERFQIFEDGHPQTLTSFDEHAGLPDMSALQAKLPPNSFSNLPLAKAGDAANILLLDALNTQMTDQSFVHAQMIKYIKGVRPGTRLAIFALGTRLRFVQGFTGDPAVLMAAVNGEKSAGNPQLSPLLQTSTEADANARLVAQMAELAATSGSAQIQASANALRDFQQENASSQTDMRVHITLEAMQQLARYLQAIPGRKNVIWFSGSFPISIFEDFTVGAADAMRQYQNEINEDGEFAGWRRKSRSIPSARKALPWTASTTSVARSRPKVAGVAAEQQMTQYQVDDLQAGSTRAERRIRRHGRVGKGYRRRSFLQHQRTERCPGPRSQPWHALLHDHLFTDEQEHGRQVAPHRSEGEWEETITCLIAGAITPPTTHLCRRHNRNPQAIHCGR